MSGRQPLMRARRKGKNFDFKLFLMILIMGGVIFVSVVGVIRWWQRADLLDPWLRVHPKYNGELHRQRAAGKGKPWLGAEAGVLDARMLMERSRRRSRVNSEHPSDWFPRQRLSEGLANTKLERGIVRVDVADTSAYWPKQRWPVALEDLVVAIPNHKLTEPQLKAGRSARLGMRTFVVTNYSEDGGESYPKSASETWGFYPDAEPARSFYPGDDRAALAPFLAFDALGDTFKWLLYGDDDTVFFSDAALDLASTMDSDLPYFVTDNLWWSPLFGGAWHPNPLAPRCLPCGYTRNVTDAVGMAMVPGCPCRPADICGMTGGYDDAFSGRACGVPRSPSRTYSMHGGAGALISIGLLRKVDWTSMERCVNHLWSSGGDSFLTQCLWEQGYAHTTPDPIWHPNKLQMFDPSPAGLNPDDFIIWKASHVLGNMLQEAAGTCTGLCKLEVEHTVSLHLRARRTGGSEEGAAAFIRAFSRLSNKLSGKKAVNFDDVTSQTHQEIADRIDGDIESGIQLLTSLAKGRKGNSKDLGARDVEIEKVTWRGELGRVDALDAAHAGSADAIASAILNRVLHSVKHLDSARDDPEVSQAIGLPGDKLEDLLEEINKAVLTT